MNGQSLYTEWVNNGIFFHSIHGPVTLNDRVMGLVTSLVRVRVRVRVMGLVTLNDRVMGLVTPLGQSVRQTVVGLVRFTWSP